MLVFFFTDIEGSTRLWEEYTDDMGEVIARHDAILRQQIARSGGQITKHTGDGVTAAFERGQPLTCALETQKQFAAADWGAIGELRIRVGLHAGEGELLHGDYFGPAVNCTARVMSAGWGGQILLTPQVTSAAEIPPEATLRDLGDHLLKDVSQPQHIYQLLHPDLPRQEFPPPRSLSGSAIAQEIHQQGLRLVVLTPAAIAVRLASATLVPTLLGDLSPSSPALVGNLGVLGDLGASSLRDWMAGFVERLHARQQGGQAVTELGIRELLEGELLAMWEAGGEAAAALRGDASRLLQAVQGVDAALEAATAEVKDALARGLVDLGGRFDEFGWMLSGVQETLAEMRARQALQLDLEREQLDLQREQLDLQREQLVKTDLLLRFQQKRAAVSVPRAPAVAAEEGEELAPADVACAYPVRNPFFHRGPIRQRDCFFNREHEIGRALGLLRSLQNVALIGQRRIGKTSLLFQLADPAIHSAHGLSPAQYVFVYLDGEELTELDDGEIRSIMAEELAAALEAAGHQGPGPTLPEGPVEYRTFRHVVRRVTQRGLKLVFCFDEFEGLGANPHLGASFFSSLRGLTGQLDVAYVTASRTPIHTLAYAQPETLSSPFFNIFAPLHLGLFSDEDAQGLVETLATKADATFAPDLVHLVLELAGPHPLLLQIAGFHALEAWRRRDGLLEKGDHAEIWHHFCAEAQPHYEYYWRHLTAEEQYTLATLPLAQHSHDQRRNVRSLEQQCLVRRRDGGHDYLSAAFQSFVAQQPVPDLLQAGPFVVDLRQRLASCENAPLSVTKTEFDALVYFLQHTGRVISPQELEEALWPGEYIEDPERVRSLIKSLRKTLGGQADCLATRRGVGYLFQVSC